MGGRAMFDSLHSSDTNISGQKLNLHLYQEDIWSTSSLTGILLEYCPFNRKTLEYCTLNMRESHLEYLPFNRRKFRVLDL